ncbi:MAG: class I SAM-dependent methyltransferase [Symplocastrum torsivum CPER-KK1]|jgi:2-polyprenyl-6-hydroxyphenyl methylase/3-demethylubiquinone-9 3-methyltransferase|uniref:Class I SAM-dependent methyltransferase n=1 Tax=Symplocastrum torsivum CPER-KK1 TaxID=450513 RepID=A0A951U9D1_9CYAN|nr:class I SAM-dependent methyltransferase [Symplocastrum torsivum CPER-KK1]
MTNTFEQEIKEGDRFQFGENWRRFLSVLNDERITEAENSLKQMLKVEDLQSKTFLDIGSGSGLFSLAARRLGATVHSFDYDPQSVACTQELKRRYFCEDCKWTIEQGSVLDVAYLKSLGRFDVVYSWGVLHHTGNMWQALENIILVVVNQGQLFIAIYNDQGGKSQRWLKVKKLYCSGFLGRTLVSAFFIPYFMLRDLAVDLLKRRNPISRYLEYQKSRGMSLTHDWYDWLGGYPFEVATPDEIFSFYHERGFVLENLLTDGGHGNNQFVFLKQ